jgi:hypothetical protein
MLANTGIFVARSGKGLLGMEKAAKAAYPFDFISEIWLRG